MKTFKKLIHQQAILFALITVPLHSYAEGLNNPLGNILGQKKKANLFNILVEERKAQEQQAEQLKAQGKNVQEQKAKEQLFKEKQTPEQQAQENQVKVKQAKEQQIKNQQGKVVTAQQQKGPVPVVQAKNKPLLAGQKSQATTKANHVLSSELVVNSASVMSPESQVKPVVQPQSAMRPKIGMINCLSQPNLALQGTLELIQAVEKAVCFNPETNTAWVQAKMQAAQLGVSKANYYPQITSTANFNWGKDDYQVDGRPDLSYDTNTRRYGLTLQANWLLYDFGTRKAQVNEAEKLLAMTLSQQNQVLQDVILKTIVAYFQIIQYELKLENIEHLTVLAKENYNIANARYKAGAGIKSEELQMGANLAKAESDLTKLKGDLKIAKGNLASLMGEPAYQDYKINFDLRVPAFLNLKNIQDLIDESVKIHPKFKAARFAVEAAQAKLNSTKTSQYPSVSFLSNMNNSKQLGETPFANTTQSIQAGIQVNIPIFDGFNNKFQIQAARENLKLKELAEAQLKLENSTDIWKSFNELQAMHENLSALKHLNQSATKAFEVVQGRYKAGVGNMLEVVNAQNVYIEARLNYSTALTEFLVTRYKLLASIGNLNVWGDESNGSLLNQ